MTTTVKEIVEKLIASSPEDDIEVNTIENQFPEFDRVDIVNAMKTLETEKVGVLIVGRRNKKTPCRSGRSYASVRFSDRVGFPSESRWS